MKQDARADRFQAALVEALLPLEEVPTEHREDVITQVTDFVRGQLDALPRRLRRLLALAFWVFRVVTRVRFLRAFTGLPVRTRRRWVERWAYGPLGPGRQLFRVVRSTSLVAYYELPELRAKVTSGSTRPS